MALFRQTETLLCYVTWVKEVEAEDEDEASEKFGDGEGFLLSETVGDSVDGYDECTIERCAAFDAVQKAKEADNAEE